MLRYVLTSPVPSIRSCRPSPARLTSAPSEPESVGLPSVLKLPMVESRETRKRIQCDRFTKDIGVPRVASRRSHSTSDSKSTCSTSLMDLPLLKRLRFLQMNLAIDLGLCSMLTSSSMSLVFTVSTTGT